MLSLAVVAACFTDSFPVRICASIVRRMFPFSTSTQCFACGTNQLWAAARALTVLPSRLVAFGMFPLFCRDCSFAVLVKSAIHWIACALLLLSRGHGDVGAAEEAGDRLAGDVARHHELSRDGLVLRAGAAAEPRRAEYRARQALREHGVRGRIGFVERCCSTWEPPR